MSKETKKKIYLMLWYVAGTEISIFGFMSVRWIYENATSDYPLNTVWSVLLGLSIAAGVLLGNWTGPKAWQKIYVEGVRGKKYVLK